MYKVVLYSLNLLAGVVGGDGALRAISICDSQGLLYSVYGHSVEIYNSYAPFCTVDLV